VGRKCSHEMEKRRVRRWGLVFRDMERWGIGLKLGIGRHRKLTNSHSSPHVSELRYRYIAHSVFKKCFGAMGLY
jgi:hypothetical protein